ncbi:uncharacterized protein LOC120898234 [Anopheles arabiensis]|uniref:Uncharacterized protein n=1 Tax=Anopheles arabiensis TaxID=7173 RepID=A0A2C9GS08_ANOAR|nr:uncharacterized protein LOC120898234 [Anopheles arabiensis]
MFAKLFIVALAIVCASAGVELHRSRSLDFPVAYTAGVVSPVAYSAPVASYSTYSGSPVTYSTYSGSQRAYSAYSAPALRSSFYYN